jgi:hypothetical protein
MKDTREERLRAKVAAVNRAHKYAIEIQPELIAIFAPFVGQKVMKIGGLMEKFKKLLPEFPNTVPLSVYRHVSDYSLAWTVKTCESYGEHSCLYYEVTVYIGDLHHGVLTKVSNQSYEFRTDYTKQEIEEKRQQYQKAKRAADDARNNLYPFGESDN